MSVEKLLKQNKTYSEIQKLNSQTETFSGRNKPYKK